MKAILAVLALAIGFVDLSHACSCARDSDDKEAAVADRFNRSQLVFLGRIEGNETFRRKDEDFEIEFQRTQFYILNSWKGEKANRVYVQSAITCCLCGYEFPKSGVYLVFAYGPDRDGYYAVSTCNRPLKHEEAQEYIMLLDKLSGPQEHDRLERKD